MTADYSELVVTPHDVFEYLGIDEVDHVIDRTVWRLISVADSYLKGSIGENYPIDDPRTKELALIIISDLYDNRGLTSTVSGNTRKLVDDLSLQLRLELRRATNESSI